MILKRIGVVSTAKVAAVIGIIVGFIAGLFMTLGALTIGTLASAIPATATAGVNLAPLIVAIGALSIIIMPILMAIGGFIWGAIIAFFYNVAAKYVGGIELDLK